MLELHSYLLQNSAVQNLDRKQTTMQFVTIERPSDFHVHLRTGDMLKTVAPFTLQQFRTILLMLNFKDDPAKTYKRIHDYAREILSQQDVESASRILDMIFALYLDADISPGVIHENPGFFKAGKLYPAGVTTNSEAGVSDFSAMDETYQAMQDEDMVLCIHAEVPGKDVPDEDREYLFIPELARIVREFPRLRIVVEHVSDWRMLNAVNDMPDNVAMTITAHHPFLVTEDARRDPHCFCLPIAKNGKSRRILSDEILRADQNPKVIFGSDSAPHLEVNKVADGDPQNWAGGVWSAPTAIPFLFDYFAQRDAWEAFEAFMSTNGNAFYGTGTSASRTVNPLMLVRTPWTVPEHYDGIVPWCAGQTLNWRVVGMEWFGEAVEA